jgi:hypothetical protein
MDPKMQIILKNVEDYKNKKRLQNPTLHKIFQDDFQKKTRNHLKSHPMSKLNILPPKKFRTLEELFEKTTR